MPIVRYTYDYVVLCSERIILNYNFSVKFACWKLQMILEKIFNRVEKVKKTMYVIKLIVI